MKTWLLNSPWSVLPLRVHIEARWSWNPHLDELWTFVGFQKIEFVKLCLLNSPRSVLPLRVHIKPIRPETPTFDEFGASSDFKKSSLPNHVSCTLHGRVCPAGLYRSLWFETFILLVPVTRPTLIKSILFSHAYLQNVFNQCPCRGSVRI